MFSLAGSMAGKRFGTSAAESGATSFGKASGKFAPAGKLIGGVIAVAIAAEIAKSLSDDNSNDPTYAGGLSGLLHKITDTLMPVQPRSNPKNLKAYTKQSGQSYDLNDGRGYFYPDKPTRGRLGAYPDGARTRVRARSGVVHHQPVHVQIDGKTVARAVARVQDDARARGHR